jgi:peptide/nickel transport system substrate-binding protein
MGELSTDETLRCSRTGTVGQSVRLPPSHIESMRRTTNVSMRRTKRLVALAAGLGLVATACGGDDNASNTAAPTTSAGTTATTSAATTATTAAAAGGATATTAAGTTTPATGLTVPTGATAMTITVNLDPKAVWEDGSPITAADLECTWKANLQTPGSIGTAGYDQITSVEQGTSPQQAIIKFKSTYGPYKTLFDKILQKSLFKDCADVSGDFQSWPKMSGGPYMLQSWGQSQSVMVPNPKYWGTDKPKVDKVVFVPQTDSDTEIASLKSGQVDYIYPQFNDSLSAALKDPNIKTDIQSGQDYEALYFNVKSGPLADATFRQALSESIDLQGWFDQIYAPIFDAAGVKGELLKCGPLGGGPFCPEDNFQNTYNPDDAAKILQAAGWKKNGQGFWAKNGQDAPKIRWMVTAGNTRRENSQAYLIPLLAQAGFNVVADNCDAACVFQQRQPQFDYDMIMYISTAAPDPTYLIPAFTCDNVPTPENGNKGQNFQGWCNKDASDALHKSDTTADQTERETLVKSALKAMDTDHILLPLVNYPKSGAWRSDKVGGPLNAETANYRAFSNFQDWTDVDGDGQIVIGAEQWPECLNPVTQCSNSSWMVWTTAFPLLPGIWWATNDQSFKTTQLVTGEPDVKLS